VTASAHTATCAALQVFPHMNLLTYGMNGSEKKELPRMDKRADKPIKTAVWIFARWLELIAEALRRLPPYLEIEVKRDFLEILLDLASIKLIADKIGNYADERKWFYKSLKKELKGGYQKHHSRRNT